jgi:hypothetical protein
VFLLINNTFGIWFATPVDPQAFTVIQAFDVSPVGGQVRYDLLYLLSGVVTVALAQLVWLLVRDDPNPRPWLFYLWPAHRTGTPLPGAATPAR